MTTDTPDFTRKMILAHEGGYVDLAELAYRLGSPVPGYGHGNLIFADDFERDITMWTKTLTGGGDAARTSATYFSKGQSLKLTVPNVENDAAQVDYFTFHRGAIKHGFGFLFTPVDIGPIFYAQTILAFTDTTYYAGIKLDTNTKKIYLHTYEDAWAEVVTGYNLDFDPLRWWPLYLTFDLETGYYDTLLYAGGTFDVSGHQISQPGDTPREADMRFLVKHEGEDGGAVAVDNVFFLSDVL